MLIIVSLWRKGVSCVIDRITWCCCNLKKSLFTISYGARRSSSPPLNSSPPPYEGNTVAIYNSSNSSESTKSTSPENRTRHHLSVSYVLNLFNTMRSFTFMRLSYWLIWLGLTFTLVREYYWMRLCRLVMRGRLWRWGVSWRRGIWGGCMSCRYITRLLIH